MNEDLKWAIGISKATAEENLCSVCLQRGALDAEDVGALQLLITTAEQVLEAGENLPYQDTGNPARDSEHNSVVDLCLPIHAKVKQELAELKALIESAKEELPEKKEYTDLVGMMTSDDKMDRVIANDVSSVRTGYDMCRAICLPILAKKNLRIRKLEEELSRM